MNKYDLVIVGAGPAGLTAAIYSTRAGLKTAIIEKSSPGGKMVNTYLVENYPGFTSISGADLSIEMYMQVKSTDVDFIQNEVVDIKDNGMTKTVELKNGDSIETKTIILATGLIDRKLNIPGEEEFEGKGVSSCVVCDGPIFRGKEILLVGGGNSVTKESVFAAKFASKVHIMNNGPKFMGEMSSIKNMEREENIVPIFNASIKTIEGNEQVEKVTYEQDGEIKELVVSSVFPYIGYIPTTGFAKKLGILDERGYIIVDAKSYSTKIKGIYGAGDCVVKEIRQITTAVSDATIAVQDITQIISDFK